MGLPTKRNKSLLLHYKPSFPGKKTKKKKPEKNPQKTETKTRKKRVYQRKKVRVFYFTINPVSQARRQKRTKKNKQKTETKTRKNGSTNERK